MSIRTRRYRWAPKISPSRWRVVCSAILVCALGTAAAQEPDPGQETPPAATPEPAKGRQPPSDAGPAPERKLPSFSQLEAAGAVIGEILIDNQNVFDLNDPKENNVLFAAANTIHIRTQSQVIRRQLLFKSGERVSERVIEETVRLMRSNRIFYEVNIRPAAYHDGIVDIEVRTRDTWTLEPGISASRSGGTNKTGVTLRDTNAFGTGVLLGVSRSSDADRTGTEYRISQPHAFGGWTNIDYSLSQLSDGLSRSLSVTRPFYALDTRWAAGVSASTDNRINSLYRNGAIDGQYRRWEDRAEPFGGWSAGLVNGWVQRYSFGVTYLKDSYNLEPDLPAPAELPPDQTLVAPFLRYEVVEDQFEEVTNKNLIQRPEYFAMGWQSKLQLGRSSMALGSTQSLWLYSASVGNGIRLPRGQTVLASASVDGQSGYSSLDHQSTGGSIRYYGNPKGDTLLFSSLSVNALKDPTGSSQLLLGGDTGLRGYPRNYQSGDRRVLFSIEERAYTDWYPFRLFRVGGAVFYDLGRAWGGSNQSTVNAGWLNDVGFGLRILSARSSRGNVLHIDLAFPLNRDPGIKSVQFLVSTQATF